MKHGEMIERVACALHEKRFAYLHWADLPEDERQQSRDLARAAIEAMREPTLAMRKVCTFEEAEQIYPAMIDAALTDS